MEISLYEPIDGETARTFKDKLKGARGVLTVAINSAGGNVLDGFAMHNALRTYQGHTIARIDGVAASMATIVALGAKRVSMADNAYFMIHNPWGVSVGEAKDMRQRAELMESLGKTMLETYAAKSGLPEDEIKSMMDAETWMTAEEAKAKGFIDEIYPAEDQSLGLSSGCFAMVGKFQHIPAEMVDRMKPEQQTAEAQERAAADHLFGIAGFDVSSIRAQYDSKEITLAQARDKVLEEMGKETTPIAGAHNHIHAGNGNIVGDSVRNVIENRAGLAERQADNRYNGCSLKELARASLQDRGVSVSAYNPLQMVGMAFTHSSSDFGGILANVATKAMLKGWDEALETFQLWTKVGNLPDFKTAYRAGLDGFSSLREVRPGAEYKYVTTSDRSYPIALATYGELFSIDRQTIINDDLSAFTEVPAKMGAAARRTVGDLVYAVLLKNANLPDGKPLFTADHLNLIDGSLSTGTLSDAKAQMRLQKNAAGSTLNITPAFLLTPAILESIALQLIRSTSVPGADTNSGIYNPMLNALTPLVEPRLDANDPKAWYLLAAQGTDTIEVAYLDGNAAPWLESTDGFTVDGTTFKVRIDAGVAPLDWRGMLKSTGEPD